MKSFFYTSCLLLFLCILSCNKEKHLEGEEELLAITSMSSMTYKIDLEYNELKNMNEGIYFADIKVDEADFLKVMTNIRSGKAKELLNEKYAFSDWNKTPIDKRYDVDRLNYSPLPQDVKTALGNLKNNLNQEGLYFAFSSEEDNSYLYLINPNNRQIVVYRTHF